MDFDVELAARCRLASRAASAVGRLGAFPARDLPGAAGVFCSPAGIPRSGRLLPVDVLALIILGNPIANGCSCRPPTPEGTDREATAVYAEGAFSAPWKE